jgi:hypothetical protein
LILVNLCTSRGELRLADSTEAVDDEDLAAAFLRRDWLELLFDLMKLYITSYKILEERDAPQTERYVLSTYLWEPVSMC